MNIYDIAEKAGVSIATVSRVLNNNSSVSPKTREKVMSIINSHNFTPKLGTGSSRSKDIVFFVPPGSLPYANNVISGIGEAAFANKMSIRLHALEDIPRKINDLKSFIIDNNIGAAIFTLLPYTEEHYFELSKMIPCMLLFNRVDKFPANYICADHNKAGSVAIQHLAAMNHRHIGIIDEFRWNAQQERLKGALDAIEELKLIHFKEDHIINIANLEETDVFLQVNHFLEQHPEVTALFVANDHFVPGLYRHFRAKGIRIPDDISIIGADDVSGSVDLHPPLTTVRQPVKMMSVKATQYLIDILHGLISPDKRLQETFDVQLIVRESTRRIPE